MSHYSIRLHCDSIVEHQLLALFADFQHVFVVQEKATRLHYQGVFKHHLKESAVRKYILDTCPYLKGNRSYSLKPCQEDIDDLLTYYCKGDSVKKPPVVVINRGYLTPEEIPERHSLYWEENERRKGSKQLFSIFGNPLEKMSKRSAVERVLEYSRVHHKMVTEFQVKRIVQNYLLLTNEKYKTEYIDRICHSL